MKTTVYEAADYKDVYLPWANELMKSEAATTLLEQADLDRSSATNSATIFRPTIEVACFEMTLPAMHNIPVTEEKVRVEAGYQSAQISHIVLRSLNNYLVKLNPRSEQRPIEYADRVSGKVDRLVYGEDLRDKTKLLVVRTSKAMTKKILSIVPIGNVPEEYLDWEIEEGDLSIRVLKCLGSVGITTYGDLGSMTREQLGQIDNLGGSSIEDIKLEFSRRGWLSPQL